MRCLELVKHINTFPKKEIPIIHQYVMDLNALLEKEVPEADINDTTKSVIEYFMENSMTDALEKLADLNLKFTHDVRAIRKSQ